MGIRLANHGGWLGRTKVQEMNYHIKLFGRRGEEIFDCEVHGPLVELQKESKWRFLAAEALAFFEAEDIKENGSEVSTRWKGGPYNDRAGN